MTSRRRVLILDALRVILISFLTVLLVLPAPEFLTPTAAALSATQVTLQPSTAPSSAEPGVTYVNLTGTNFPSGTIAPNGITVNLAPAVSGPAMTATVKSVTTLVGTSRRITFQVSPANSVASPTPYLVTVSGTTSQGLSFVSANTSSLTINPAATIALNPASGQPGQTLAVTINGNFTNFFQGATFATFGPGISVGGAAQGALGLITVANSTSATAQLQINAAASVGSRNVTVQTGAEMASSLGGFSVISALPVANPGGPYSGNVGQTITFNGTGSAAPSGQTIVRYTWNFGDGLTETGPAPTHAYGSAGPFTVSLSVTDTSGGTNTASTTATIAALPSANAGGPYSGNVGQTITFNGTRSTAPSGQTITLYGWNFGDGSTGAGATATHAYGSAGPFTVSLNVTDTSGGTNTASTTATIAALPSANAGGPYSGNVGQTIIFNGTGSTAPSGQTIIHYDWNFGDGLTGTGSAPTHAYGSAGPFTVSLSVTDTSGGANTASTTATIAALPGANPGGPYSGNVGQTITFNGTGSTAPSGQTIIHYDWNFGDGLTGTGSAPTHAYGSAGPFTVSLSVTDTSGGTNTASTTATIAALPGANPGGPYSGTVGQTITFNGTGSTSPGGDPLTTFSWNFGDSSTATGATPTHAYTTGGTFSVSLMVTDATGGTNTATTTATISAPPVLRIFKSHSGSFTQGQLGAAYTLTVSNTAGAGPTSGAVTVTDTVPSGLTLISLAGTGWSCVSNSCTRSDALAGGASYPSITSTVNVAANASSPQVNVAGVAGGGSAAASATDSTLITANPPALTTVNPNSGQLGQTNESVNLTGQLTHWLQGTTTVSFGAGITVASLTVNSPGTATAVLNIDPAAATGARDVTVTTGAEVVSLVNAFTVFQSFPAPTININSPVPGSQINQPSDVFATITDNAQGGPTITWTVDLQRINTKGAIRLGSGVGSVANQKVGTIDPTLIANDTYSVIITVDKAGQTTTAQFSYDVTSANLKLGNYITTFPDISTQIAGLTITLLREYNSLDVSQGDFGPGWRLRLPGRVSDSATPGAAFTTSTRAYVTRPDGRSEGFTFNQVPQPFPFFGNSPIFIPDPGVTDTLIPPSAIIFCGANGCNDFLGNPYHPTNFVLQTKDQFQYTIDEFAGLQQITDPNGNTITVTSTGLTSSTGVSVPFTRDSQGRITSITGPSAGSNPLKVTYAYDPATGNLVSFVDQLGNQTQYFYENPSFPNYLTRVVDPLGRALVRNVFDSGGHLIATCNANGNVTTLAGCTTYSQSAASLTQTIISPRGFREDFFLDSQGNVLIDRHFLDTTNFVDTVRTYDVSNNMLTEKDPAGNITSYTYNKGNVLTVTQPGNRTTTYTYNGCNQITTNTDPAGHVSTYTFDSNCNLLSEVDPLGNTTTYQYNSLGELTSFIDAVGNQRTRTYDATGLLTQSTDPFGAVTTYQYDPSGYLLSETDRNGRRIDYQYDVAHHVTTETWNTTPPRVTTYSYDADGELIGASSPDYSTTLAYDQLGRLITSDNQGTPGATHVILNYSYDADDHVTNVGDSLGGSTQYTYDPLTRLSQIVQTGSGVSTKRLDLLYDPSNVTTELRRFADAAGTSPVAKTLFQYDCGGCADRITAIQNLRSSDGATLDNLTYALDPAGNVTSSNDAEGAHQYAYDADRQLLTATHTQTVVQPNEFYTYDKIGNRLTSHSSPNYVLSYMNGGKGSRLLNDAQFTYVYDAEGNLTRRTSTLDGSHTDFTWDHFDRLTSMVETSGAGTQMASETYVYDFAGRRIRVIRPQGVEQYFYFGLNPVLVLDGAGNVLSRNLYGLGTDELYAQEQAAQTKWTLSDRVNSVRDTVSNTATVLNHFVYDSFGDLKAHSSPIAATEDLFAGREFSTSPLMGYFRARYYSPDIGRFLSEDALEPFNYTYAGNNACTLTDPLGLDIVEYSIQIRNRVFSFAIHRAHHYWTAPLIGKIWCIHIQLLTYAVSGPSGNQSRLQIPLPFCSTAGAF
jgi:RHS repeat-associated protein